jgi:hypothetical protein
LCRRNGCVQDNRSGEDSIDPTVFLPVREPGAAIGLGLCTQPLAWRLCTELRHARTPPPARPLGTVPIEQSKSDYSLVGTNFTWAR